MILVASVLKQQWDINNCKYCTKFDKISQKCIVYLDIIIRQNATTNWNSSINL